MLGTIALRTVILSPIEPNAKLSRFSAVFCAIGLSKFPKKFLIPITPRAAIGPLNCGTPASGAKEGLANSSLKVKSLNNGCLYNESDCPVRTLRVVSVALKITLSIGIITYFLPSASSYTSPLALRPTWAKRIR